MEQLIRKIAKCDSCVGSVACSHRETIYCEMYNIAKTTAELFMSKIPNVCRYRCAKIGDTYRCAKGKNFAGDCDTEHCPLIVELKTQTNE